MVSPDMLLGHSGTLSQPFQAPVEQNEGSTETRECEGLFYTKTAEDIVGNVKRCDRPGVEVRTGAHIMMT